MAWQHFASKGQDSKHGNQRSTCALGHSHRSKLEHSVCQIIQLRQRAGELELVQVEDTILISGWYKYIPDFKCKDTATGDFFWIEAKGFANDRWPSTKRGWRADGPGKLEVWGGSHANPKLIETIIPKGKQNAGLGHARSEAENGE